MTTDTEQKGFQPPYMSWATFEGILDQLKANGIPDLIDRSVLDNKSGADQTQFLKAAEGFKLIDANKAPTERMQQLVNAEDRSPLIEEMLREAYPGVIALGTGATQAMLEDEFRKFGYEGADTLRKAITYYLNAARQTNIELSQHFKATRPGAGGRRSPRRTRKSSSNSNASNNPPSPPPPPNPVADLHPAIVTLVKALPEFNDPSEKPAFADADRQAWFAYAEATFNLIYSQPQGASSAGGGGEGDE